MGNNRDTGYPGPLPDLPHTKTMPTFVRGHVPDPPPVPPTPELDARRPFPDVRRSATLALPVPDTYTRQLETEDIERLTGFSDAEVASLTAMYTVYAVCRQPRSRPYVWKHATIGTIDDRDLVIVTGPGFSLRHGKGSGFYGWFLPDRAYSDLTIADDTFVRCTYSWRYVHPPETLRLRLDDKLDSGCDKAMPTFSVSSTRLSIGYNVIWLMLSRVVDEVVRSSNRAREAREFEDLATRVMQSSPTLPMPETLLNLLDTRPDVQRRRDPLWHRHKDNLVCTDVLASSVAAPLISDRSFVFGAKSLPGSDDAPPAQDDAASGASKRIGPATASVPLSRVLSYEFIHDALCRYLATIANSLRFREYIRGLDPENVACETDERAISLARGSIKMRDKRREFTESATYEKAPPCVRYLVESSWSADNTRRMQLGLAIGAVAALTNKGSLEKTIEEIGYEYGDRIVVANPGNIDRIPELKRWINSGARNPLSDSRKCVTRRGVYAHTSEMICPKRLDGSTSHVVACMADLDIDRSRIAFGIDDATVSLMWTAPRKGERPEKKLKT